MTFLCGSGRDAPDPDMPCCIGSAMGGACDCWQAVLEPARSDALQEGPQQVRPAMCHDCAYRPGSPEREAEDGALPDHGAADGFMCHDGMPRPSRWEHPSGVVEPGDPADYQPRRRGNRAWRADGRPALMCAGWAAVNGLRTTR